MTRTLTSAMQTASASRTLTPVHLVAIYFDGGTDYLTDAYKDIVYDGNTYQSTGNLLSISDIDETLAHRVNTLQLSLSGVNQANIATALLEDFINRDVVIYRGLLDSNGDLIVDPFNAFRGQLCC